MKNAFLILLLVALIGSRLRAADQLPAQKQSPCSSKLALLAAPLSREALREKYLGKDGFLNTKMYSWALRSLFVRHFYISDVEMTNRPHLTSTWVLSLLESTFNDAFLRQANSKPEADAALVRLAELMKITDMTEREYLQACARMVEVTKTPELREELRQYIETTLPVHGPMAVRSDLGKTYWKEAKEPRRLSDLATFSAIMTAAGGIGGFVADYFYGAGIGPGISAAIGLFGPATMFALSDLHWLASHGVTRLEHKSQLREDFARLGGRAPAKGNEPVPALKFTAYVSKRADLIGLLADRTALREGKWNVFGDEVVAWSSLLSQELFTQQASTWRGEAWQDLEISVRSLLMDLRVGESSRFLSEVARALYHPFAWKFSEQAKAKAERELFRTDVSALREQVNLLRQEGTELLQQHLESSAGTVREERKLATLEQRLKLLEATSRSLNLLYASIEGIEEKLNEGAALMKIIEGFWTADRQFSTALNEKQERIVLSKLKQLHKYLRQLPRLK